TVVCKSTNFRSHRIDPALQLVQLVLGQRFGREEVHGAGVRLAEEEVQDRQVVAERLAAGSGRHNDNIASRFDVFKSLCLVKIKPNDPATGESGTQARIDAGRKVPIFAIGGGLMVDGAYGRIGFPVQTLKTSDDAFKTGLPRDGQLE